MNFLIGISPLFAFFAIKIQGPFLVGVLILFGAAAILRILKFREYIRKNFQIDFALFLVMLMVIGIRLIKEFETTGNLSGPTLVLLLGFSSFYISLNRNQDWFNSFFIVFMTVTSLLSLIAFFEGSLGNSRSGVIFEIPINLFGIHCALAASLSFYVLISHKSSNKFKTTFLIAIFLINSIGVLHASSYGAILAYVATFLSFQIFRLVRYQRFLSLAGVIVIFTLSFSNFTFDPFNNIEKVTKVSESIVVQTNNLSRSTDSGRALINPRSDSIWSSISDRESIGEMSIKSLYLGGFQNILFGTGTFNADTDLVLPSSGSTAKFVPHNAFISFTMSYGVISLACFLAIIARRFLKGWRSRRLQNMVPFLPVWLSSLFIDLQWTFLFMTLLVALASLRTVENLQSPSFQESKGL
jgi:hypothetical protein